MYPKDDNQFEVMQIKSVQRHQNGEYTITRADGWSFGIQDTPIEPRPGMIARFYGKGIGSPVRGLFIDGHKIFYRAEEEDKESRKKQLYGESAEEWLRRWDAGKTVWTIEMGGLGPGYEQAIHIACAEILRHLLHIGYDSGHWEVSEEFWNLDRKQIEEASFKNEEIAKLGLSGAQYGAALNLAVTLYIHGPVWLMTNEKVKHRKIQVSKNFP